MLELILGWPVSVNSYWLSAANGRHKYIGRKGVEYRADVYSRVYKHQGAFKEGLIDVSIKAYPPDKRVRDLDNILKCSIEVRKMSSNSHGVFKRGTKFIMKSKTGSE